MKVVDSAVIRRPEVNGCVELACKTAYDARGIFVKAYSRRLFRELGIDFDLAESFYTTSAARVLRGMHFQLPPADHAKLVYCIAGRVMDVALDLRRDSTTFQQHCTVDLSAEAKNALYIPRGVAHGFYVLDAPAIVMYHVSTEHNPALDTGVAWDSFGARWPDANPILSPRDAEFVPMSKFDTPFRMAEVGKGA